MLSRFEYFSSSVAGIFRCIQKIERTEMAKYGLKGPHAQCLVAMAHYPEGLTSTQLCTICEKDKAAVSRTVAELEREGLVSRKTQNGSRYRAPLTLTPKGEEAARHVNEKAGIAVEKAGGDLTEQQRRTFYEALDIIADKLQMISAEGIEA